MPHCHCCQVLPDVSTWEYQGKQPVHKQQCHLWELKQRYQMPIRDNAVSVQPLSAACDALLAVGLLVGKSSLQEWASKLAHSSSASKLFPLFPIPESNPNYNSSLLMPPLSAAVHTTAQRLGSHSIRMCCQRMSTFTCWVSVTSIGHCHFCEALESLFLERKRIVFAPDMFITV